MSDDRKWFQAIDKRYRLPIFPMLQRAEPSVLGGHAGHDVDLGSPTRGSVGPINGGTGKPTVTRRTFLEEKRGTSKSSNKKF
jgi:hypothetical protein